MMTLRESWCWKKAHFAMTDENPVRALSQYLVCGLVFVSSSLYQRHHSVINSGVIPRIILGEGVAGANTAGPGSFLLGGA